MSTLRGLDGKNVLITGAASGIGRAVAARLGAEGATVGIIDMDGDGAEQTAATVREGGGRADAYRADITDTGAVEAAVGAFVKSHGEIGALINNAGWDQAASFLDTEPEFWRKVIDINLFGHLNVSKIVLAQMVESGGGRVVSIASDAGRVGSTGEAVYAACKGGLVSWSKSVARELARNNITLNCVAPGPTDTPLFASFDPTGKIAAALERAIPMKRLARPDDFPGIVCFLVSEDAGFITGQTISVSGGLTMHG